MIKKYVIINRDAKFVIEADQRTVTLTSECESETFGFLNSGSLLRFLKYKDAIGDSGSMAEARSKMLDLFEA